MILYVLFTFYKEKQAIHWGGKNLLPALRSLSIYYTEAESFLDPTDRTISFINSLDKQIMSASYLNMLPKATIYDTETHVMNL